LKDFTEAESFTVLQQHDLNDGYELIDVQAGAWSGLDRGLQVTTRRLPPHRWGKMRIDVPFSIRQPTRISTDFWIESLGANCWYLELHFGTDAPAREQELNKHTIKFDNANLRTYGCFGEDSSTRTQISAGICHKLAVEIVWGDGEHMLRHSVDDDLIFTSRIRAGPRLSSLYIAAAAYSHNKARWADLIVE